MDIDGTFLKGHIFDQVVLLAVTCNSNNNWILVSCAIVTSETEDNWVWYRPQLEKDLLGPIIFIADNTKGIESQQFQGDIRNSECLFAWCLKHLAEKANETMTGIKGREDIACISKLGKARTNRSMNKSYRISEPSILKHLGGLTKGTTFLLAMCFLRMDSDSLVSQPIMHVSQQTVKILFSLRDIWL